MTVKVAKNRFIPNSSLHSWVALYQQLFSNLPDIHTLGALLIREAETAQTLRQAQRLEELGLMLSNLPVKEYQVIGQYYAGWGAHLQGEETRHIFEQVLENSTTYKERALIGLAAVEARKGDYEAELKYFVEAATSTNALSVRLDALRGVAIVKAKEGYRKQSLADLEGLLSLARYTNPKTYLAYLNSFAVELTEAGRVEEATNICRILLVSPVAFAYPEWRETGQEVAEKAYRSRGQVSVAVESFAEKPQANNLIGWPEREVEKSARNPFHQKAKVINLARWKEMPKKRNGDEKDDYPLPDNPTERDIFMRIMHLASQEGLSTKKLWKMLEAVERVNDEKD